RRFDGAGRRRAPSRQGRPAGTGRPLADGDRRPVPGGGNPAAPALRRGGRGRHQADRRWPPLRRPRSRRPQAAVLPARAGLRAAGRPHQAGARRARQPRRPRQPLQGRARGPHAGPVRRADPADRDVVGALRRDLRLRRGHRRLQPRQPGLAQGGTAAPGLAIAFKSALAKEQENGPAVLPSRSPKSTRAPASLKVQRAWARSTPTKTRSVRPVEGTGSSTSAPIISRITSGHRLTSKSRSTHGRSVGQASAKPSPRFSPPANWHQQALAAAPRLTRSSGENSVQRVAATLTESWKENRAEISRSER